MVLQFLHARNLATCSEEYFRELKDEFVWMPFLAGKEIKINNPSLRKWGGILLIIYGLFRLWDSLSNGIYHLIPDNLWREVAGIVDEVPQFFVAVVVIIVGLRLIAGKKEELNGEGK